ncbi:MAG: hypothetical protein AAFP90_03705, partial [Planctomycetota bacterium]
MPEFSAVPRSPQFTDNSALRGYQHLLQNAYVPTDLDDEVFDQIWQVWPDDLKRRAENATPMQRRLMAFQRYGLTPRPREYWNDPQLPEPLQYVIDEKRRWAINCFSCHSGTVYGVPHLGAPNNRFALQTLTEDSRSTKMRLGKALGQMELGSMVIPLGTTNGTSNAVIFGVALMHARDAELNFTPRGYVQLDHHDMDAPAWWHFHKRPYLYIDGFAQKGHRGLMQFMLVRENGPEKFR